MLKSKLKTSGVSRYSILWRRLVHKPITTMFKVTLKRKIKLIRNNYTPNGKPAIYAVTHVFYDDIAAVCCCFKRNAFLLSGIEGPNNTPSFIERIALRINGVIVVNRANKYSRETSFNKTIEILNNRGDIQIYPESAWNFSPNVLISKLNWGIIKIAKETGANIVPVAVDIVDNDYCVILGNNFDYENYTDLNIATDELRNKMATLSWELICLKQPVQRETLTDLYWLNHIQEQYVRMPRKNQSLEEDYMYRPKDEIGLSEILADMHGIENKSMAVDYERYKEVEKLIENWTKPVNVKNVKNDK